MPDLTTTWKMIHSGRAAMADTIEGLSADQWSTSSLCDGWSVGQLAAHVLAGAEQTGGHFALGMLTTGFRFNALMERDLHDRAELSPTEIATRLRHRTTTTNHPPAPVMAMLGEIVVHGEDLRRPLGLPSWAAEADALNACLDMYVKATFPVGGKKRIEGLRLATTDTGWSYGTGPEVKAPAISLMLAMTGRAAGAKDLAGDGAQTMASRLSS
ncbi:MAG TPA: maleylpyruvate isomerase family mycothiol-dependent enzyme [Streptosporangiaceae bacterium]|nr:maleylpyruvate isomerase family mycothiol-dependent enzyme [Streptosporangiaceae bacterium]